jgi:hypothetical protein
VRYDDEDDLEIPVHSYDDPDVWPSSRARRLRGRPDLAATKELRAREEAQLSCAGPADATGEPLPKDLPHAPRVLAPFGDAW